MGECLPRRVPPDARKRLGTVVDKMTPGSFAGGSFFMEPITEFPPFSFPAFRGGGGPLIAGQIAFYYDHWAADGGAETLTLTNLPMPMSEHVYWQGIEQRVGTDYTLSGTTLSILTAMGTESGDLIEVRYAYNTGLTAPVTL